MKKSLHFSLFIASTILFLAICGHAEIDQRDFDGDGDVDGDDLSVFAEKYGSVVWYKDFDGDEYSDGDTEYSVSQPFNYYPESELIATTGDCDDGDDMVNPGMEEMCDDDLDNDCDGLVDLSDPDCGGGDGDGDGWTVAAGDCDDGNHTIYPGAPEIIGDDVDQNCDGTVSCYVDLDNDGYGAATSDESIYTATNGIADTTGACGSSYSDDYADNSGDCDDINPNVFPGNSEICDGQDNDCVGGADFSNSYGNETTDADGDGALACNDCNDSDSEVFPGNPEICDGKDNDCNGSVDHLDVPVSAMCPPGGQNVLVMGCYGVEGCRAAECVAGYYGDDCENEYSCNGIPASDPAVCSGNGACVNHDTCQCNDGWWGSNCEIEIQNNIVGKVSARIVYSKDLN